MVAAWVVWLCGSRSVVLGWSASLLYRYLSLVAAVVGLLSWDGFGRGLVDFSIGFAVMGNGFADRHGGMVRWRSVWKVSRIGRISSGRFLGFGIVVVVGENDSFFVFFFFLSVILVVAISCGCGCCWWFLAVSLCFVFLCGGYFLWL